MQESVTRIIMKIITMKRKKKHNKFKKELVCFFIRFKEDNDEMKCFFLSKKQFKENKIKITHINMYKKT